MEEGRHARDGWSEGWMERGVEAYTLISQALHSTVHLIVSRIPL